MTSSFDAFNDAFTSVFPALASASVQEILRHQDASSFLAWMREKAPEEFPELFTLGDDDSERRAIALALGRALWNVVPLPKNGYRPQCVPTGYAA